jgi:hypothetical protein
MKEKRKKRGLIERLPYVKAMRLARLGEESGRKKARDEADAKVAAARVNAEEKISAELRLSDKEWQRKFDRAAKQHAEEIEQLQEGIQEMRDSHADQLKLFRRIYRDKNAEADRILDSLREKLLQVDRRHFAINEFLSEFTADIERLKTKQEMQVVRNTEDTHGLKVLHNMQASFDALLSESAKLTKDARAITRRELN